MNAQTRFEEPLGLEPEELEVFNQFTRIYQNLGIIKDEDARVGATATIMKALRESKHGPDKDVWRKDPVTEPQRNMLSKMEHKYGAIVTDLIDQHLERLNKKDPKELTKGEASDEIFPSFK